MKKSIFLFFAAILCAMSVQSANTMRIYCKNTQSWWKADNAAVGAYYWGTGGNANSWPGTRMTKVSGQTDLWYIDVDIDKYQNIIFTRVNGSGSVSDWGAKTNDLIIANTKNQYKITQSTGAWDGAKSAGTWETYKPTSTAALATSAANIFVGGQATLTSSLTSNASANTIKETAYAISPAGANVSGNTFTATAEGTYTITATVTYYPLGCPTLTSTATAETTIKAEVPAEETHDVTVSYLCGSTKVADPTTVNTVGVETPVKVTAPEIAKYTFSNWTLGADVTTEDALTNTAINITTKAGGSDFTLVANYEKAKLTYTVTVPAGTENCYMAGDMNGWDVDNPIELTKQSENVFTVTLEGVEITQKYKYLSKKGTWDYAEDGGDRTWTANDVVTAWKDPLATNVYLAGEMNGWSTTANEFKKAAKDDASASIILNLTAGTYKFKVVDNGAWLGNNSTIDKTISGWTFAGDKGDCPLKATIAGDYTFTWAISTKKLSVTYPTICAITATANDDAMGTVAGAGEYGKGSTATLTATPNDGYLFVNWTKGGEIVATTQEYSFKVTEAVALVANFEAAPEEVHNVTVSYVCGGNKIADDQTVAAVGETSAKTVEAPEIWGYTFSSWTLGADVTTDDALTSNAIDINIVAGGSDFTLTANYTEIPKVTVYFVNNKKWSKVYAYGWGGSVGENPVWPGQDITANKEAEQIAGFDVHSYSVVPGSYVNIKFTNNLGTESNNFVWTNGKYYYMDAEANYVGGTKEEVTTILAPDPLATNVYLAGEMTNWGTDKVEFKKETAEGTIASVTVNLTAKSYTFQLVIDGNWYGNTGTMKRGGDAVHEGGWSFEDTSYGANCTIVADIAGDYTFTWDLNTKKLTVAYPPLPKHQVNATVNPAESGTVTGTGEYEQGSEATLVANPAAGYTFKNWTVAGTEKSAEATYKFTVTETVELVANFVPEVTHEVTVSYLCNGTPIPGQAETTLAVGVTTPSTISAPSITNYKFDSWTLGTGVQSEDESKNPIKVTSKSTGEYTLAANYTKIELTYNVQVPAGTEKCFIRGEFDGWDKFHEMTKVDDTHYTITIEGATTEHKYKYACGDSWDYVEKDKDGNDIEDRTYSANDVVIKWGKPVIVTYQLKGVGGWDQPGIELVQNPGNDKEYMLTCQAISATDAIKIVRLENGEIKDYYGNGTVKDGVSVAVEYDDKANIKLPAGTYNFYFDTNEPEKKLWIEAATDCEPTPDYTRTVTAGNYGTICLPFGGTITGAVLYECVGRETGKVYLGSVTTLAAGVPYIFQATATELAVYSDGTTATSAGKSNGLHGTFDNETVVATGNYILLSNTLRPSNGEAKVNANRAYLVMSEVPAEYTKMPGRRYIGMDVQGENETTGVEDLFTTDAPVKVIENGQLIIIRDGVKYNVQGQKL